jgi:DNA polymerase III subunit epsilon
MREIVFDTETTGVFPDHAEAEFRDRIVEIGCVEIINLERTGREFHVYLNPERSVPEEVVRVHGLTRDFLLQHSKFADIADMFLEFVGDAPLVAHNAAFDQGFINAEFRRLGRAEAPSDRFIDTLQIARKKFPGASCSLDALARRYQLDRYGFDLAARKGAGGHGALIDARILAEVYLQLKGGREQRLVFEAEVAVESTEAARPVQFVRREPRATPLASRMSAEEMTAHEAFIATLGANALWLKTGS